MVDMLPKFFCGGSERLNCRFFDWIRVTDLSRLSLHTFYRNSPRVSQVRVGKTKRFFETVRQKGCSDVRCVTSPVNKGSIVFHTSMEFRIKPGDAEVDGVQVKTDYDGWGQNRVRFMRELRRYVARKSQRKFIHQSEEHRREQRTWERE